MRTHRCGHTCRSKIPKGSTINGGILSRWCRTLSHIHMCNKLGWHKPKLVWSYDMNVGAVCLQHWVDSGGQQQQVGRMATCGTRHDNMGPF